MGKYLGSKEEIIGDQSRFKKLNPFWDYIISFSNYIYHRGSVTKLKVWLLAARKTKLKSEGWWKEKQVYSKCQRSGRMEDSFPKANPPRHGQ